jgi:hypothetical protein
VRKTEWMIALSLVVIGLSCLTMSATWIGNSDSFKSYLEMFLEICIWIGIPLAAAGVLYFIFKKRGER